MNKLDMPKKTRKKEQERIKREFKIDAADKKNKKKTNQGFIAYA